ncbi:hypothetical protein [Echinicola pacifica]|nr:hypothetical protein [Echinicola pacifica]
MLTENRDLGREKWDGLIERRGLEEGGFESGEVSYTKKIQSIVNVLSH